MTTVPAALRTRLARLEFALQLALAPDRRLARTTGEVVSNRLTQWVSYPHQPPDGAPS